MQFSQVAPTEKNWSSQNFESLENPSPGQQAPTRADITEY